MNRVQLPPRASLLVALATAGLACVTSAPGAEPDLSKLPPSAAKPGLTFERDIRPLFETSCLRCHGEERPKGDLRLDSREAVLKGGEGGKAVIPGDSRKSTLVHAVAQIDDETAMPPKRRGGGPGGPGGPGGRGGFGPGMFLAPQLLSAGDKNGDHALSTQEFSGVADAWFDKLDPAKAGTLSQEQWTAKLGEVLPAPAGGRGPGPARFVGPSLFTVVDQDKNGAVTRAELKQTFASWAKQWDRDNKGSLGEEQLRDGLNAALPRPEFGGPGGRGGPGAPGGPGGGAGRGAPGGPGGPGGPGRGGFGPPPPPLTPEQVGLVRAWIDQGAK